MKSAAGIAALAALGLVAVNYSSEATQLFLSERVTEEEMAYMRYVTEFGKSYGTKAEFKFRLDQFKKTMAKMAEHQSNALGLNSNYEGGKMSNSLLMSGKGLHTPASIARLQ